MSLIDAFRYSNFIRDEESFASTESRGAGLPRYGGETSRLSEYSSRVRARMAKEKLIGEDEVKKLVYNLIRCPVDVLDLLKRTCDKYRWEQSAFTLENLEGDYYIPGHVIGNVQSQPWREYKVRNTVTLFFWFVCFLEWMFFSKSGC